MNIRIASLDLFSIIFPGIIACLLFLPLLPNALRELLYKGNDGWIIILFFSIVILFVIMTVCSKLIELLLNHIGKDFRINFQNRPFWLIDTLLKRVEETFEINTSQLQRTQETGELTESDSTELFYLISTFVSERARLSESNGYRSLENLFKNLLTIFTFATVIYPIVRPYPITEVFGPNLEQRLIISIVCGALAVICFFKAKTYNTEYQRETINRFMSILK